MNGDASHACAWSTGSSRLVMAPGCPIELPSQHRVRHRPSIRRGRIWTPDDDPRIAKPNRYKWQYGDPRIVPCIQVAGPTLVHDNGSSDGSGATTTLALGGAQTQGHTLVVFEFWDNITSVPATVNPLTDTKGNSYVNYGHSYPSAAAGSMVIWVATNIAAAASSANTITAKLQSGSPSEFNVWVLEVSACVVDVSTVAFGNDSAGGSTPSTSGPVTTGNVNELFIACCFPGSSVLSAGTNLAWTLTADSPDGEGNGCEYVTVPGSGTSVTAKTNLSSASNWLQGMLGLYTPSASQNTPNDSNFFGMPF